MSRATILGLSLVAALAGGWRGRRWQWSRGCERRIRNHRQLKRLDKPSERQQLSSSGQSSPTGNTAAQPPAVRAKTALIPQGRESGRGARREYAPLNPRQGFSSGHGDGSGFHSCLPWRASLPAPCIIQT